MGSACTKRSSQLVGLHVITTKFQRLHIYVSGVQKDCNMTGLVKTMSPRLWLTSEGSRRCKTMALNVNTLIYVISHIFSATGCLCAYVCLPLTLTSDRVITSPLQSCSSDFAPVQLKTKTASEAVGRTTASDTWRLKIHMH